MLTFETRLPVTPPQVPGFVDLTDGLQASVTESEISEGRVTVFSPSERCRVLLNERESGLLGDIAKAIERMNGGPVSDRLVGSPAVVLPVAGGKLKLGTWQRVLLLELDRPVERSVVVQIVGE